jgi:hypothetical protein
MNSKLKLDLDDLAVESFQPSAQAALDGTVVAHETGQWDVSCGGSCADTCDPCNWETRGQQFSCYGTCDYTCDDCEPVTRNWSCGFTCGLQDTRP